MCRVCKSLIASKVFDVVACDCTAERYVARGLVVGTRVTKYETLASVSVCAVGVAANWPPLTVIVGVSVQSIHCLLLLLCWALCKVISFCAKGNERGILIGRSNRGQGLPVILK